MVSRSGVERRKKKRIQLSRAIIARFSSMGAVVLDVTDAGARIEHFARLDLGRTAKFRMEWEGRAIEVEAEVRSCRVHRFAHGDDGVTVYQSGLLFTRYYDDAAVALRELVATIVSRSLAEQVANARGIGPVTQSTMPVFRSGDVVVSSLPDNDKNKRLLPASDVVVHRGYVRCTFVGGRSWQKKWTRSPDQPEDGFTVLATEPNDHVDSLCKQYEAGDSEGRKLIRLLARCSLESPTDTPEPI